VVVSGQGCNGTRCFKIIKNQDGFAVDELWHTPRSQFFYCNWIAQGGVIYGFDSSFLVGLDASDGKVLWKNRDQTDANVLRLGEQLLLLRGDGLLTAGRVSPEGFVSERRLQVLADAHCWTPPTVIENVAYVRNSKAITAVDLGALSESAVAPRAPRASAIDAALEQWSGRSTPAIVTELGEILESEGRQAALDRYKAVKSETPEVLNAKVYAALLQASEQLNDPELQRLLAADWLAAEPRNPSAYEALYDALRAIGRAEEADRLARERLASIQFVVAVPDLPDAPPPAVYLTGNCRALGNWQADGVPLTRAADGRWRGELRLPKGDIELKVTLGSWDRGEVDRSGADRANRRIQVDGDAEITLSVDAWKQAP
jgi:hypothetical protein